MDPQDRSETQRCGMQRLGWLCAWNWKCALMSAVTRSLIYSVALMRSGNRQSLAVIGVEMLYVTFTSGLYAGLQQKALGFRRRWLGDVCIVLVVPWLSQVVDWLVHRAAGAPAPHRALASVAVYMLFSSLFHRHVMRQGAFITGETSHSMLEDFRRVPRLVVSFVVWPGKLLRSLPTKLERSTDKREDFEAAA